MIFTFCSIDTIILAVWYLKDPMYLLVKKLPLKDPDIIDEDIKVKHEVNTVIIDYTKCILFLTDTALFRAL